MLQRAIAMLAVAALAVAACSSDEDDGAASTSSGAGGGCGQETGCEACFTCALDGPCKQAVDACTADAECQSFRQCITEQDDPMIIEGCRMDHPTGSQLYCAYTDCAMSACDALCEPSVVCP